MRQIKIGDRFRLGAWDWEIIDIHGENHEFRSKCGERVIWLEMKDVDQLEWIEPKITFNSAQVKAIKAQFNNDCWDLWEVKFKKWLDDHVEK